MKKKILQLVLLASLSAISFNSIAQSDYGNTNTYPHRKFTGFEYVGWDANAHTSLDFKTYNNTRMTIYDNNNAFDGFVGIGTAAPQSMLCSETTNGKRYRPNKCGCQSIAKRYLFLYPYGRQPNDYQEDGEAAVITTTTYI